MIGKARVFLVLLLFLGGAGISGLLWLQHHGETQATSVTTKICGDAPDSGCQAVNQSPYSEIAGMPLGAIGLFFYLSLGLLLALGTVASAEARFKAARLAFLLTGLAFGIDLVLFGLQAFKIGSFCKLCLSTYALNFLALALLFPARPKASLPSVNLTPVPDNRVLMAGWVMGSAAVALGIAATEINLHQREAERQVEQAGAMLGLPANFSMGSPQQSTPASSDLGFGQSVQAAESPTPTSTELELQERLRKSEEERQKLQAILDDPQKVQEYYAQKALAEFENSPSLTFDLSNTAVIGKADAPIQVVEFSDVLCPFCRQLATAFDNFIPQSNGRVAVHFKHYPLEMSCNERVKRDLHPGACNMALGLICAQQQGKFEAFYKKAFEGNPPNNPQVADVVSMATGVGLDGAAMEACLNAPETKAKLKVDIDDAAKGEVGGTPTIFINGKKLANMNYFFQVVEKESARLGLPPLAPPQPGH